MAQLSLVMQNTLPTNNSVFHDVSPFYVGPTRWGPPGTSGHDKIANSLRGLYVNKEALVADADNRRNEPFVGHRGGLGTFTQGAQNFDLNDAYNKYLADEYNWTSNPQAASSAANFNAFRRNSFHNPNYGGVPGEDGSNVDGNTRIGFGTGHRDPPQRADPILEDGFTKRQAHVTRTVYPAQFLDYNGFNLDKVRRIRREREFYIDDGIAKKYARDRVANVSSSHHAFLYRDPYEAQHHQPYVEANLWLNYPNV
jgi:hypothetical protein